MKSILKKIYLLFFYSKIYQKIKFKKNAFLNSFNKNVASERTDLIKNSLKFYFLFSNFKKEKINIVECGVGSGESLSYIHKISKLMNFETQIWAFDSFEGFPKFSIEDKGKYKTGFNKPIYKLYDVEYVKKTMKSYDIDVEQIEKCKFIKGFFPESFKHYNGDSIDFLHIDVDLYNSYKHCLEYFWPYLKEGSVVVFDEYKNKDDLYKWPGASKAIDEFFFKNKLDVQKIRQEKFKGKFFYQLN